MTHAQLFAIVQNMKKESRDAFLYFKYHFPLQIKLSEDKCKPTGPVATPTEPELEGPTSSDGGAKTTGGDYVLSSMRDRANKGCGESS